ncbi:MAG TPA: ribbon-helix-helix protein, CopG family [Candidatus Lumbricidophila sp.]|nr:ribbon-helix-helix protein, CopG family [Candidatus Lumbricidophila sp.]
MALQQVNIKMDSELVSALDAIAKRTGRSKTYYLTELVKEFLEDAEDYALAVEALEEHRRNGSPTLTHSEFWARVNAGATA